MTLATGKTIPCGCCPPIGVETVVVTPCPAKMGLVRVSPPWPIAGREMVLPRAKMKTMKKAVFVWVRGPSPAVMSCCVCCARDVSTVFWIDTPPAVWVCRMCCCWWG